jgi:hypothetical protein
MPVECPGTAADLGHFIHCRATAASLHTVTAMRLQPERSTQNQPVSAPHQPLAFPDIGPESADPEPAQLLCDTTFTTPLVSLGFPAGLNPVSAGSPGAF